jgi:hypothetical protein
MRQHCDCDITGDVESRVSSVKQCAVCSMRILKANQQLGSTKQVEPVKTMENARKMQWNTWNYKIGRGIWRDNRFLPAI